MACQQESTVITEPVEVSWGRQEITCVTPVFPVVESSHILISSQSVGYYLWQNDGAGVDPAVAGRTGIEIDTSAATSAAEVAQAWVTAIEANGSFYAKISEDGLSVEIKTLEIGATLGAPVDVDTTATVELEVTGVGGDLGFTQDAVEFSFTLESLDLTVNQLGTTPVEKTVNGVTGQITMTLAEMTVEKWELIIGDCLGGKYTPPAGTQVVGVGRESIGKSFFREGGILVVHPLNRATKDRDLTFFKCCPLPDTINFDSQAQQGMSVTFDALIDESINPAINLWAYGDSSQDLRA